MWNKKVRWGLLAGTAALIALTAAFSPLERTLGANARLVYFHGAWVWAGKLAFAAAGLAGLGGLITRRPKLHTWSQALGWTGMFFWLTYLPLSLYVQQANWGGIFWDEPRWRIPLMFGVVGVLLQAGLLLVGRPWLTSLANLGFGAALWIMLGEITNVLHPDSPILSSGSAAIQVFFALLLALSVAFGAQVARMVKRDG